MEAEKKSSAVSDVGAWAMNIVSSVGIIMANKQLMSANGYAFSFGETKSYRSYSLVFPFLPEFFRSLIAKLCTCLNNNNTNYY